MQSLRFINQYGLEVRGQYDNLEKEVLTIIARQVSQNIGIQEFNTEDVGRLVLLVSVQIRKGVNAFYP